MNTIIRYKPEAIDEIEARFRFYQQQSSALCRDFLTALDETIDRIYRFPLMYAMTFKQFRATTIGKFQDVLYYRADPNVIFIGTVIYGRRDPRTIRKRLS